MISSTVLQGKCDWKMVKRGFSIGALTKRCSENMQQIYRRAPIPKENFNNVAKQFTKSSAPPWVFFTFFK